MHIEDAPVTEELSLDVMKLLNDKVIVFHMRGTDGRVVRALFGNEAHAGRVRVLKRLSEQRIERLR